MTRSEDWNPLTRNEIFRSENWVLVQLTLSANRSRMMFNVCELLILNWIAFHVSTKAIRQSAKTFHSKDFAVSDWLQSLS